MAKNFLTEPPNNTQPNPAPTHERENKEPVRVIVIGSRKGIITVVHWLVRLGFTQMAEWSSLQPAPNTGKWMCVVTKWVLRK
jgi:hypothetical protein